MVELRPSTSADVPRLFEIWRGAVLATHHFLSPDDFAEIERLVRDDYLPAAQFTVAADGGRVLGFMGLTAAHVDALFVDPAAHGRGVGRALIEAARRERGPLTVDVNAQNASGAGFYEKMGFRQTGRSETDDAGRPYPILHLADEAA
jgi:putative acetyltransferase